MIRWICRWIDSGGFGERGLGRRKGEGRKKIGMYVRSRRSKGDE